MPPTLTPPRGRLLTPKEVQTRYLLDESGQPLLSTRWVVENVRPAVRIARGVVKFYEQDADAFFEKRRIAA